MSTFSHRHSLMSFFLMTSVVISLALESEEPIYYTKEQLDSLERVFNLDEIVVTGTRTPKALKDVPIQTRLITEADLKQIDATNIQDLLQQELPGIEFSYAMNQQVNMNFGGFAGQSLLILMDGERLAGETMENIDFSRLNLNGIARVEIIRGAASALYGSNASGGVINLISKEADKPLTLNLNCRRAAHGEWRAGGTLGIKSKWLSNVADVTFNRHDTYTVCLDIKDLCDFRKVYGNKSWNFRDRLTFKPANNFKTTLRAGYYFKEHLFNVDAPNRYRDFSASAHAQWAINENNTIELNYSFDQYDKSDWIKEYGVDVRDYSNVQHTVRALFNHNFDNNNILTFGGDFSRDYLDTYQFADGETHRQYTADAFVQYDQHLGQHWEIVGASRWDYFSDCKDNQATTKLNFRYRTGSFSLRGGYAGGFRAPSLKEKYMMYNMADIFYIHGNPDLTPEHSHNFNLSTELALGHFYLTLGANYNDVHNRITTSGIRYMANQEPYIEYLNVDRLKVFGADVTIRGKWANGISTSLSYNYTHEESPGATITQYCPARPHSLNFRGSWTHQWTKHYSTDFSISGRYLSAVSYMSMYMYEPFEDKPITNPAYTLWKAQLIQHFGSHISLNVAVDNILNYIPAVYSFNAPITTGSNLMIGINIDI